MNKVECVLDCRHSVRLSVDYAEVGTSAYCRLDGWQVVETVHRTEYRVLCCHCQYGRWCGQSFTYAQRLSRHHERARTGHLTTIVRDTITASGGTPRKTIIAEVMKSLPSAFDESKVEPVTKPKAEPPPF